MTETFYEVLRRQGITRRSFLQFCSLTAASLGLGANGAPDALGALATSGIGAAGSATPTITTATSANIDCVITAKAKLAPALKNNWDQQAHEAPDEAVRRQVRAGRPGTSST